MIPKRIDDIAEADIEALVEDAVSEGRQIEYKRDLPGGTDDAKREFLADVSSFANGTGGDLLYGIKAEDGVPKQVPGLKDFNADGDVLRLEQVIQNGIDPRIPGIRMQPVGEFDLGPVLIIRVPNSWTSPHMVTFKKWSRFFVRTDRGKQQMDVREIGAAFALSQALPERIRDFRDGRLGKVLAGETPVPLVANPRTVLHVIPLASLRSDFRIDLGRIPDHVRGIQTLDGTSMGGRFNLDGFVRYTGADADGPGYTGYCQVFRTGTIETVDAYLVRERDGRGLIPHVLFEENIARFLRGCLSGLHELDVPLPLVITASLTGVKGYEMAMVPGRMRFTSTPIDRDIVVLPDVLIEDYEADVPTVLRPIFDAIWNAAGWERSMNYTEEGRWEPEP